MSRVTDLVNPEEIRGGWVFPPNRLANVILSRTPENDWNYLKETFPEIIHFIAEGEEIPSDVVNSVLHKLGAE